MHEPPNAPLRAILFKVMSVIAIVVMLALIKSVKDLPIGEVVFFRCLLSILPIWLWLAWRGQTLRAAFRTERPFGHVTRTIIGLFTMSLTFVAVRALPLPEAVTLQYSQPLFVVAFSAMFLGEAVRRFRWGAVVFGFLGVLVVAWPKLTLLSAGFGGMSQEQLAGAGAALLAAATHAAVMLLVRQLVRTESPATVVLWFWAISSALSALTALGGWVALTPGQFCLLALSGILGGLAQMFMAESLRAAPASTTAPFEYTSFIFASALGFAVFGDIPGASTLSGGAMVIGAGLMIIWRETRIGRGRVARTPKLPPE